MKFFVKIFVICLLFANPNKIWAQEKQAKPYQLDLDKADYAFKAKKYNTAAQLYQKVYPKIKDEEEKQQILFSIAESYRNSNNFKKALQWFEEVVNSKYPDPAILFSYGQLLKNFERYDEAGRAFYDYSFENPTDKKGKLAQQSCLFAANLKANPKKYKVENMGGINTDQSEYAPFYVQGKLVFSSTRKEAQGSETFEWTGQKYSDLFVSTLSNKVYGKPQALKALNTNFNEGVAWFDPNYTTSYFTQCNGVDGKGINCKIYVSYFQNGNWIEPKPLPFNSDSFSIGHPAFSADGKRLFFTSDMPGTIGGKDIWYVSYDAVKDQWGIPQNAGLNINSTEDDMFPFVAEDGTLYFASKGRMGMGGFDLFETKDSAETFALAQNLGSPINSGGDDFSISFIPKAERQAAQPYAFFCSNREGGMGDDDIYSLADKPIVILVKAFVYDRESKQAISGALLKTQSNLGKKLPEPKTNDKGIAILDIPLNDLWMLGASKDKYLSSASIPIDTRNILQDTSIEISIALDLVPSEDIEITMQGIYYDLDKWDVRPDARKILDSLASILNNNTNLVIELASHTDSRAPAPYNLELSKKRAQSCVNYLAQKGIQKERLLAVGYGETKLVNDCSDDVDCSEEEHQQNRRTTVRIVRSDFKPKR
jgi:outer membrane protein OmpA-like peptidoglycan-associated protein/tetratricopeptide (TPR) repeat protein